MTIHDDRITERLDQIESSLPSIPSKAVALARAATRRSNDIVIAVRDEVDTRSGTIRSAISTASRTTAGQARSAALRSTKFVRAAIAETTGQAVAQTEHVVDAIEAETEQLLDTATAAVDPAPHKPGSLEDLTKDELYTRAQARDVQGRAGMNKAQLLAALRA